MSTIREKQNPLQDFTSGFASLFQGMWVTAVNLVARRKITEQYPYERRNVSARYRGLFYLPYNEETKRLNCTGCTLCEQACPTKVISMTKLGSGKNGGVSEFNMDLGRCMFCNLCIEACPFEAIYMGPAYELASTDRDASKFDINRLATGGAVSVEQSVRTISALLEAEAAEKAAKAAMARPKPAPPAGEAGSAPGTAAVTANTTASRVTKNAIPAAGDSATADIGVEVKTNLPPPSGNGATHGSTPATAAVPTTSAPGAELTNTTPAAGEVAVVQTGAPALNGAANQTGATAEKRAAVTTNTTPAAGNGAAGEDGGVHENCAAAENGAAPESGASPGTITALPPILRAEPISALNGTEAAP